MKKIVEMFIVWRAGLRLSYAVRRADKEHTRTGDRYYVMPDHRGRLIVMRRRGMRLLRRHGVMDRRVRMTDLLKESFYFTPDRGQHTVSAAIMEQKREMYLRYVMHWRNKNRHQNVLQRTYSL